MFTPKPHPLLFHSKGHTTNTPSLLPLETPCHISSNGEATHHILYAKTSWLFPFRNLRYVRLIGTLGCREIVLSAVGVTDPPRRVSLTKFVANAILKTPRTPVASQ